MIVDCKSSHTLCHKRIHVNVSASPIQQDCSSSSDADAVTVTLLLTCILTQQLQSPQQSSQTNNSQFMKRGAQRRGPGLVVLIRILSVLLGP